MFSDVINNEASLSKFKISIGVTSTIPPDEEDDLWCNEAISFEVNLSDLETSLHELVNEVEANIGVVGGKLNSSVKASYLSNIWGSDVEKAQKTINIMSQLYKHDHPSHL